MSNRVTYSDLRRKLVSLGFQASDVEGSHRVFRHRAKKSVVVLPFRKLSSPVDRTHLAAVRRVLVATDVVSADAFAESFFTSPKRATHSQKRSGHEVPLKAAKNGSVKPTR